jgi:hypothetical protein
LPGQYTSRQYLPRPDSIGHHIKQPAIQPGELSLNTPKKPALTFTAATAKNSVYCALKPRLGTTNRTAALAVAKLEQ